MNVFRQSLESHLFFTARSTVFLLIGYHLSKNVKGLLARKNGQRARPRTPSLCLGGFCATGGLGKGSFSTHHPSPLGAASRRGKQVRGVWPYFLPRKVGGGGGPVLRMCLVIFRYHRARGTVKTFWFPEMGQPVRALPSTFVPRMLASQVGRRVVSGVPREGLAG